MISFFNFILCLDSISNNQDIKDVNNQKDINKCSEELDDCLNKTISKCKSKCISERGENDIILRCFQDCGADLLGDCIIVCFLFNLILFAFVYIYMFYYFIIELCNL